MSEGDNVLMFGPFRLSRTRRRLERDGEPVRVGSRALDILLVLAERAGEVISKEDLLGLVWPDTTVDEIALRVHIASLRKALGDGLQGARYITNVPGRGYCFVTPISRSEGHSPESPRSEDCRARLPRAHKRIIGREDAIADASRLVSKNRFVTVVGAGGVGKTTVALAVAHALADAFRGNVRFIDLGTLLDDEHVTTTVAAAVGLGLSAAATTRSLSAFLREEHVLLVLDNCEHVMSAVAPLAEELVAQTRAVHILATSREPLRVEGEHVFRLSGLEVPPASASMTAEHALTFPAVQLFMERAMAAGAGLALANVDASLVAQICRRLDGIALAIEFAAGRVEAYGLRGTASLLENRFKLLWHGRRTAVPRHRTLRAMLDWSYNLLDDVERKTLRRLSVLVGFFPLDAVAAVACADASDDAEAAVDALASLVDKSLLSVDSSGNTVRYRLLDTTRAYALGKLAEAGEHDATSRRLVNYLRRALDADDDALCGPHGGPAIAYLGSVRAGLEWAFSEVGDAEAGAALVAAAAPMFMELSLLNECQRWAAAALASLNESALGTRLEMDIQAAFGLSSMFTRGNSPEARAAIARGLTLADEFEDGALQMRLLGALSIFASRRGEFRETLLLAERVERIAERLSDPAARALADWMKGTSLHLLGDQVQAERRCRSALTPPALPRRMTRVHFGFDHRIRALVALGRALWLLGRADDAMETARSTLRAASELGQPVSVAIAHVYTSTVFLWCGELDAADELVQALATYANTHSLGPYQTVARGLRYELLLKRGNASIDMLQATMETLLAERHTILQTTFATALAEGLAAVARYDEAHSVINEAIASTTRTGGSSDLPEMLRVKGRLLEAGPEQNHIEAEAHFLRALESARAQGALGWELRSAIALARLWSRQGRLAIARDALAERYERFTQGFGTADLREARQLLEKLRS